MMFFFKEIFEVLWYLAYIAFFGIGLILYVASKFVKYLPTLGAYKVPAEIGGVVMLVIGAWLGGALYNEESWDEKLRKANQRAERAEKNGRKINTEIKIEYRDRVKVVTDTKVVIETKIKEVATYIDRACTVTDEAVWIHNQAAQGKIIEKKK